MTNRDLTYCDAVELAELIRTRQVSPVEVMQARLDRIAAVNSKLNAIVTINEYALEEAKAAEAVVMSGQVQLGPLHGVPFTVKDSIDTTRIPTQRGSPIFRGRVPKEDATSVARMKAAGAILLAKTNLPEFSYSTESNNLLTGRSNNPWNIQRTPGGSSGGESAAIAAGMSPLGLGTDLAISVRGPAAQTGIMALKPTHGRIPMTGIWPRAPRRLWHVGPMARSVRDLALAYSVLAGPDGQDSFSSSTSQFDTGVGLEPTRKLKIGWLVEPGFGPIDPEVNETVMRAAAALKGIGCDVENVRIPALEHDFALDVFMQLHKPEVKSAFAEATLGQPEVMIFDIARNMLNSSESSLSEFLEAERAVDRLKDGFASYFVEYDALLCPVLPRPAHEHDARQLEINGQTVDSTYVMAATVPLNLTGLPGLSMRFGTSSDGLPINVQIVSTWSSESTTLHVAQLLEKESKFKDCRPRL